MPSLLLDLFGRLKLAGSIWPSLEGGDHSAVIGVVSCATNQNVELPKSDAEFLDNKIERCIWIIRGKCDNEPTKALDLYITELRLSSVLGVQVLIELKLVFVVVFKVPMVLNMVVDIAFKVPVVLEALIDVMIDVASKVPVVLGVVIVLADVASKVPVVLEVVIGIVTGNRGSDPLRDRGHTIVRVPYQAIVLYPFGGSPVRQGGSRAAAAVAIAIAGEREYLALRSYRYVRASEGEYLEGKLELGLDVLGRFGLALPHLRTVTVKAGYLNGNLIKSKTKRNPLIRQITQNETIIAPKGNIFYLLFMRPKVLVLVLQSSAVPCGAAEGSQGTSAMEARRATHALPMVGAGLAREATNSSTSAGLVGIVPIGIGRAWSIVRATHVRATPAQARATPPFCMSWLKWHLSPKLQPLGLAR